MKSIIVCGILVLSQIALAGEGAYVLECRSATGKTKVSVTAAEGGDRWLTLTLTDAKGKEIESKFSNEIAEKNAELNNDRDPKVKVGPIIMIDQPVLAFAATSVDADGWDHYPVTVVSEGPVTPDSAYAKHLKTFRARLTGDDPRSTTMDLLKPIELTCTYTFSL